MTHPMLDVSGWDDITPDPRVLVADGTSVTVNVYGGCLNIKDGPQSAKRERVIPKVPRTVRHIVILSTHGYVSLEAQSWMHHCDITWCVIDPTGKAPHMITVSGQNISPKLMRKQALCSPDGPMADVGIAIIRRYITRKLEGQAANAELLLGNVDVAKEIRTHIDNVAVADSVAKITGYEGLAATKYWDAWDGLPVRWLKPAPKQPHWQEFSVRRTLRRTYEDNRGATDPINAALNFGYKMAETECTLACYTANLSPAMGISHVDRIGRDSFALDLIETIRPRVDEIILGIFSRPMDKRLFTEDREGIVRLRAPLTHEIASAVHAIAYQIQAHILFTTSALGV